MLSYFYNGIEFQIIFVALYLNALSHHISTFQKSDSLSSKLDCKFQFILGRVEA